jgi:hypothetical protein
VYRKRFPEEKPRHFQSLQDGSKQGSGSRSADPHRQTKKVLRKAEADDTKINSLANIVVLNEKANRSFSSKEPQQYLKEFEVKVERLKEQFVPTQSGLWEVAKYEELLDARSKLLAKAATDLLKELAA